MDITSYLLGKQSGGGSANLQEKSVTITSNTTTNITADEGYDGLSKATVTTIVPANIDLNDYFGSLKAGNSNVSGLNTIIKKVPDNLTITGTSASYLFYRCSGLTEAPQLDTSNITNMVYMFGLCSYLTAVPQYDTSSVTDMWNMFYSCSRLTYASINNILAMCINATSYTGTKKLTETGISLSYYDDREIEKLSNYQDFLAAGWTIN